jgi:hypothetical protein
MRTLVTLIVLSFLGGVAPASAQSNSGAKSPQPPRPPVIIDRSRQYGPPPSPATRPYPPPQPEIGRPMERVDPPPSMTPRVGN